jgi:hypothetical protein
MRVERTSADKLNKSYNLRIESYTKAIRRDMENDQVMADL